MLRKLLLIGFAFLFERGSVAQIVVTMWVSVLFLITHMWYMPYKIQEDNYLRAATEIHVVLTVSVALVRADDPDHILSVTFSLLLTSTTLLSPTLTSPQVFRTDVDNRFTSDRLQAANTEGWLDAQTKYDTEMENQKRYVSFVLEPEIIAFLNLHYPDKMCWCCT
jgi:hypothetical protein